MSEGKVEQWMRDAAKEYLRQAHADLMECMIDELSKIIAAHAPSLAAAYERGVTDAARTKDILSLLQANPYVETEVKK